VCIYSVNFAFAAKHVMEGVHVVSMGKANAVLIESQDGLTLIDAGFPNKEAELRRLIFTHGHPGDVREVGALSHERSRGQTIRARLVHSAR